jgi:hypothetical protein
VECDKLTDAGKATATDNCDPAPVVDYSDVITSGTCPESYTITRTWTATDDCGNSVECVQTITVKPCGTPPPCECSLVVEKRDEAGHPIDGAVFEVNGTQKTITGGEARWDNLECNTTYEVEEISPEEKTERVHLGDCEERSTLRVVNEAGIEVLGLMLPEAGPDLNFTVPLALSGLVTLRILLGIRRKRYRRK